MNSEGSISGLMDTAKGFFSANANPIGVTAFATSLQAGFVLFTIVFAYFQFREAARIRNFGVIVKIFEEMHSGQAALDRNFIDEHEHQFDSYELVSSLNRNSLNRHIELYQRIAFFAERGLVPKEIILAHYSKTYTDTWNKVENYVKSYRRVTGTKNYASAYEMLSKEAKKYRERHYPVKTGRFKRLFKWVFKWFRRLNMVPNHLSLTEQEIEHITEVTFDSATVNVAGAHGLFVFGATHAVCWETAIQLYQEIRPKVILISGGRSKTERPHSSWSYGSKSEAEVICNKLIQAGIPKTKIIIDDRATNSLENVLNLKEEIIKRGVTRIACICKSYAAGRQRRTFQKHLPGISVSMVGYDTAYNSREPITRKTWHVDVNNRSLVIDEYLKNCVYAKKQDIVNDFCPLPSMEGRIRNAEKAENNYVSLTAAR